MRPGGVELELVARVATGILPKSVEVSPDGQSVFVCNFGLKHRDNVWRYDTASSTHDGTLEFRGTAVEIAFTGDGQTLFVSDFGGARVFEVDAESLEIRDEFRVDHNPKVMALSPDEHLLYVSNWSSNTVSVVDLERGKSIQRLKTGAHPRGLAVHADGSLFAAAMYADRIHVFGPSSSEDEAVRELRTFEACEFPRAAVFVPDQSLLFVTCSGTNELAWYEPDTGRKLGAAPVGENPRSLAMSRDGRFFAVANFDGGSVSLVDTHGGTYGTFDAPKAERIVGIAVQSGPELERVYATSWQTNELLVYEPRSG